MRAVLIVVALLAALGMVGLGVYLKTGDRDRRPHSTSSSETRGATQAPQAVPTVDVSAVDLEAAYRANEYRADQQYKGQVVRVTGVVVQIGKDIRGRPDVMLRAGDDGVLCAFEADDDNLLGLDPGTIATLHGTGAGYHMRTPLLQGCAVDEVHGAPCTVANADNTGKTVHGECLRTSGCMGVYYKGLCDGPADIVCCVRQ